jgi:hypothetical protein
MGYVKMAILGFVNADTSQVAKDIVFLLAINMV